MHRIASHRATPNRLAGIVPKLRELHSHYSEAAAFIDGMRTTFGLGPLASTKELRAVLDACESIVFRFFCVSVCVSVCLSVCLSVVERCD